MPDDSDPWRITTTSSDDMVYQNDEMDHSEEILETYDEGDARSSGRIMELLICKFF